MRTLRLENRHIPLSMCRLLVFRSRNQRTSPTLEQLLIAPSHSILKQSHSCMERTVASEVPAELNADGFGIAWYKETDATEIGSVHELSKRQLKSAAVLKSIVPAWNSPTLRSICPKIRSDCVFGHVRAATPGSAVTEANAHPFSHGQWTFMHNGCVGGWGPAVRRRVVARLSDEALETVLGSADSEFCFALFLTEVGRVQALDEPASVEVVQGCLLRLVHALEFILRDAGVDAATQSSLFNFCVTDGRTLVATRHVLGPAAAASLYMATGSSWEDADGKGPGTFHMVTRDRQRECVIFASERLTWQEPEAPLTEPEAGTRAGAGDPAEAAVASAGKANLLETGRSASLALPADEHEAAEWVSVPRNHIVTVGPQLNILVSPIHSVLSHPSEAAEASAVRGPGGAWEFMEEAVAEAERGASSGGAPATVLRPAEVALAAAGIDTAPSGEPDADLLRQAEQEMASEKALFASDP